MTYNDVDDLKRLVAQLTKPKLLPFGPPAPKLAAILLEPLQVLLSTYALCVCMCMCVCVCVYVCVCVCVCLCVCVCVYIYIYIYV